MRKPSNLNKRFATINEENEREEDTKDLKKFPSVKRNQSPIKIKDSLLFPKIDVDLINEEQPSTDGSSLTNSNQNIIKHYKRTSTPSYMLSSNTFTFSSKDFKGKFKESIKNISSDKKEENILNSTPKFNSEENSNENKKKNIFQELKKEEKFLVKPHFLRQINSARVFKKPYDDKNQISSNQNDSSATKTIYPKIEKHKSHLRLKTNINFEENKPKFLIPKNKKPVIPFTERDTYNKHFHFKLLSKDLMNNNENQTESKKEDFTKNNLLLNKFKGKDLEMKSNEENININKNHSNKGQRNSKKDLSQIDVINTAKNEFKNLITLTTNKYSDDPEVQNMLATLATNIKNMKKLIIKRNQNKNNKRNENDLQKEKNILNMNVTFGKNSKEK
ncbi:MAG: hypothetical protein MJ252_15585 [archaeon]|nr:hypothetical protein [archaeon]